MSRFLSTPPSRVATYESTDEYLIDNVSIHATLAGGDVSYLLGNGVTFGFLSTPPSRVATVEMQGCS